MQVEADVIFSRPKTVIVEEAKVRVRIPYDPDKSLRETEDALVKAAEATDPALKAHGALRQIKGWRQVPDEKVDTTKVEAESPTPTKENDSA